MAQRNSKDTKRITVRGVSLTVSPTVFDDVDLVFKLRDIEKGKDPLAVFDLLEDLFGEKKRDELVDAIRDPETRKAKISDLATVLMEVFEAFPKS